VWLRIWRGFKVGVGFIKAWQIWVFWRVGLWILFFGRVAKSMAGVVCFLNNSVARIVSGVGG